MFRKFWIALATLAAIVALVTVWAANVARFSFRATAVEEQNSFPAR